jgi:hypothetical protein
MSSEPIFVEAAMPTFSRALHMALTVRDMRVSADWDERVLGFDFVKEFEWGLRPPSRTWMAPSEVSPERRG